MLTRSADGDERRDAQLRLSDVAEHGRAPQPVAVDADRHAREHVAAQLLDQLESLGPSLSGLSFIETVFQVAGKRGRSSALSSRSLRMRATSCSCCHKS